MRDGLLVPAEVLFEGMRGGNESLAVQRALGEWLTPGDPLFFEALDRANTIRNVDPAGRGRRLRDRRRRRRRQRHRDLRAPQPAGRAPAPRRSGGRAPDRPDGQLPGAGARGGDACKELRGFAAPEGHEEGSRGGAFIDTDLLIRARAVPGRRRRPLPRGGEAQAAGALPEHRGELGRARSTGFKSAVALFRNAGVPGGDWLPYRYLLFAPGDGRGARPRARRALGRRGPSPPACGATTAARWTPSWPRTRPWPRAATSTG